MVVIHFSGSSSWLKGLCAFSLPPKSSNGFSSPSCSSDSALYPEFSSSLNTPLTSSGEMTPACQLSQRRSSTVSRTRRASSARLLALHSGFAFFPPVKSKICPLPPLPRSLRSQRRHRTVSGLAFGKPLHTRLSRSIINKKLI